MILSLIAAIILGLGVAYFAIQNTHLISITLANYPVNLPLYLVVIGTLLLGLFIAFLFNLIGSFSTFFALRGKDSKIKETEMSLRDLRRENQKLELENARLRGEKDTTKTVTLEGKSPKGSLLDRVRQSV